MKKRILGVLLLWVGLLVFLPSKASHEMGAEMEFVCQSSCTVRLILRTYRDCTGASFIGNNVNWAGQVPGCTAPSISLPWVTQPIVEVTPICSTVPTQCTTPGASINGVQKFEWYQDYNICSGSACVYDVVWSDCCRNPIITSLNNAGSQGILLGHNTYNTGLGSCNNSPHFSNMPIFYACTNQDYDLHQGAYDPDGDSLSYELGACYQASNTSVVYAPGYSALQPFGPNYNITIDPITGILHIDANPGASVVAVLCIYVREWRNGVQINTYQRDMQVSTLACGSNNNPSLGPISNLTAGTNTGDDIYLCTASPVCFDIASSDPDPGQNLTMYWDGVPSGATFTSVSNASITDTITGTSSAPPAARFCWTPPGPGNYQFRVHIEDDNCPIFGMEDRIFTIHVGVAASTASATLQTCPDVLFNASGCASGTVTYTWSGAGGLSSTSQTFTHTYPSAGSYPWQVIITNGSTLNDTIRDTVTVGAPQPASLISGTYFLAPCVGLLYDTIMGPSGYASYLWSNGATSQDLPVFLGGTYGLTVTDANGCQSSDSAEVFWASPDLYGVVTTSTGAPLQNQKILLVSHDTIAGFLSRLDSAYTDSSGYYFFCGSVDTVMHVKAIPSLFGYPGEVPTYADSALFWYDAISVLGYSQLPMRLDFSTLGGTNLGGLGFIGGYVSQGANKMAGVGDPVVGLQVLLMDVNSGATIGYATTNPFGYFSFGNLPAGEYAFKVDVPNMFNPNPPTVTLGAGQMHLDSLDFRLHSTYLELVGTVTAVDPLQGMEIGLNPNPFNASTTLHLDLPNAMTVKMSLCDVFGRQLNGIGSLDLEAGQHEIPMGDALAAGVYFLRLEAAGQTRTIKLVKSR
jgi:hypothetical protein